MGKAKKNAQITDDILMGWKDIIRYLGMSKYRIERCGYIVRRYPFVWASKQELDAHTKQIFMRQTPPAF